MKSSHILALSLLIISPAALARVVVNTDITIPGAYKTYSVEHYLADEGAVAEVDADDNVRVTATLVTETETEITIMQTISERNPETGEYNDVVTTAVGMPLNQNVQVDFRHQTDESEEAAAIAAQTEPVMTMNIIAAKVD